MRTLLENDFIVTHGFKPSVPTRGVKDGDIIPHKGSVSKIEFYKRIPGEYHDTFVKVELTNHDLTVMKKAMEAIESEVKDLQYSSIPF